MGAKPSGVIWVRGAAWCDSAIGLPARLRSLGQQRSSFRTSVWTAGDTGFSERRAEQIQAVGALRHPVVDDEGAHDRPLRGLAVGDDLAGLPVSSTWRASLCAKAEPSEVSWPVRPVRRWSSAKSSAEAASRSSQESVGIAPRRARSRTASSTALGPFRLHTLLPRILIDDVASKGGAYRPPAGR